MALIETLVILKHRLGRSQDIDDISNIAKSIIEKLIMKHYLHYVEMILNLR